MDNSRWWAVVVLSMHNMIMSKMCVCMHMYLLHACKKGFNKSFGKEQLEIINVYVPSYVPLQFLPRGVHCIARGARIRAINYRIVLRRRIDSALA